MAVTTVVRGGGGCHRAVALEALLILLLLEHHGATVSPAASAVTTPLQTRRVFSPDRSARQRHALPVGPADTRRGHLALHASLWRLRGGAGDDGESAEVAVARAHTSRADDCGEEGRERGTSSSLQPQASASLLPLGMRPAAEEEAAIDANATTTSEDGAVFGMRKGLIGVSGGGWAMDALRRACWYVLDIVVIEAQRLRFVGHLLAAAGIVRREKIPPLLKRRRGAWWRASGGPDDQNTPGKLTEAKKPQVQDEHGPGFAYDDADDGAGLVDFLRRGIAGVGFGGETENLTASQLRILKKHAEKGKAPDEEQDEDENEDEVEERRPTVLQQWPPPPEHFARVGECVRLIDKRKTPGALALGVRVYNDTHLAEEQTPDDVFERLALLQRDPEPQGRRLCDDSLLVEGFFSPRTLNQTCCQVDMIDGSCVASLARLRDLLASVLALQRKVRSGAVSSAPLFEAEWQTLLKRVQEYNAQESAAEQELGVGLEGLVASEAGDSWRGHQPIDYDFGRMSKEELDVWLEACGFKQVPAHLAARLAATARPCDPGDDDEADSDDEEEGEEGADHSHVPLVLRAPSDQDGAHAHREQLAYALSLEQPMQDVDWAPYLPADWPTQESHDTWTKLQGVATPKDLAPVAAHILGSRASFPEEWPEERRTGDLSPFWIAYEAALSAGVVERKHLSHVIEEWLSRNIKCYPAPDALLPSTSSATSLTASLEQAAPARTGGWSAADLPPSPAAHHAPERGERDAAQAQDGALQVGRGSGKIGGMLSGLAGSLKRSIAGWSESDALPVLPAHDLASKDSLHLPSQGLRVEPLPVATAAGSPAMVDGFHDSSHGGHDSAVSTSGNAGGVAGLHCCEEEQGAKEEDEVLLSSAETVRSLVDHDELQKLSEQQFETADEEETVDEEEMAAVSEGQDAYAVQEAEEANQTWGEDMNDTQDPQEAGVPAGEPACALDSWLPAGGGACQEVAAAQVEDDASQALSMSTPPPAEGGNVKELAVDEPAVALEDGEGQEQDLMVAATAMLENMRLAPGQAPQEREEVRDGGNVGLEGGSVGSDLAGGQQGRLLVTELHQLAQDVEDKLVEAEPLEPEEAMGTEEVQGTLEGEVHDHGGDMVQEQGEVEQVKGSGTQEADAEIEVPGAQDFQEAEDDEEYEQVKEAVKKLQLSDAEYRSRIERAWHRSLLQVHKNLIVVQDLYLD